jgi:nucleoside-diphosphate-sugar epimerase
MTDTFLVTGALGCIGAWVVRNLVQQGAQVVVLDAAQDPHRLRLIMSADELAQVRFLTGDITQLATVQTAVAGVTHIIHLAALQVPFCKANPPLGAAVNVVGTVNLFEAAKQAGIKHLTYASSVAVYGRSEEYDDVLGHDAPLKPRTHYGVYKQANEGTARVYWLDDGISSIGLRPYTVYGAGRDQGMTSAPTKAMLAAAAAQPYHIPFGGRVGYQYAADVAQIFIQAARTPFHGAEVFNLRGSIVTMTEMIHTIEKIVPAVQGKITFDEVLLPFPEELDDTPLQQLLGTLPHTPLETAVAETITLFRAALADGRVKL